MQYYKYFLMLITYYSCTRISKFLKFRRLELRAVKMKRTSSTASLLSTKRIIFFRVRRQPRKDSKKDQWTIPMDNLPLTKHCSESTHAVFSSWNR